jgi:hypothetical protein
VLIYHTAFTGVSMCINSLSVVRDLSFAALAARPTCTRVSNKTAWMAKTYMLVSSQYSLSFLAPQ